MKMILRIVLFLSINFFIVPAVFSCSCCYYTTTFCGGYSNLSHVALIKILDYEVVNDDGFFFQDVITAEVIDDLNDNIAEDTITVLGNNGGGNCVEYIAGYIGSTVLYRFGKTQFSGNTAYIPGGCGLYHLLYNNGILYGKIIPGIEATYYDEFVSNFLEYESYPRHFRIRGKVWSWPDHEQIVPNFSFSINGYSAGSTDSNGKYSFPYVALTGGGTHQPIEATSDTDVLNGVTIADVVKVSKHILGIEPIYDSWSQVAADINNSLSITTLDLILMKKTILNPNYSFNGYPSWRFVRKGSYYPWLENNPTSISNLNLCDYTNIDQLDLAAIKMGDVNRSYQED